MTNRVNTAGLLFILLIGCGKPDPYQLFQLDNFTNDRIVSLDTIENIRQFNKYFWLLDSANPGSGVVFKYSFEKGEFNETSEHGVSLKGLPFDCLNYIDCQSRNSLKLNVDNNGAIRNDENQLLDSESIQNLFISNMLNNGNDPNLSENSKESFVEIYIDSTTNLHQIGRVIKLLVDKHSEMLRVKVNQTGRQMSELKVEYPINISLREEMYFSAKNRMPIIDSVEINKELLTDSTFQ